MMASFTPQPDEGYSEDPLTAPPAAALFFKPTYNTHSALGSLRPGEDYPPWLVQHLSGLSIARKSELVMALLSDLPTSAVSQIVHTLSPRLYIDFVRYMPPEVCLKILEYLDPLSLLNVARCCRTWYSLAVDRKLWETLYHFEGWKALPHEISEAELEVNGPATEFERRASQRPNTQDHGQASNKPVISSLSPLDGDTDTVMTDAGSSLNRDSAELQPTETSIFGGPKLPASNSRYPPRANDVASTSFKGKEVDRGMGALNSLAPGTMAHMQDPSLKPNLVPASLARSGMWVYDRSSTNLKINWKYLYSMRRRLESNWERGKYINFQFPHPDHPEEGHGECIYSLQYNSEYLVSSSRDRTLKVWDMKTRRCLRTLVKHRGSVLCLQFDSDPEEDLIVSGSSDSDVIIWQFSTGKELQTLKHAHKQSVLNLKFDKRILVTCSKDKYIRIFNRRPLHQGDLGYPEEVDPVPRKVDYGYGIPMTPEDLPVIPAWTMIGSLIGHNAAVNAVQIHEREVVSASGDKNVKVWDWPTQACTRTILGHHKGIACVQFDGRRIITGSSDCEVKVFDRQTGLEVANLRAHSLLVRTLQAGFADLPGAAQEDFDEARRVDMEFFKAVEKGLIEDGPRSSRNRRPANAGSKRPEDLIGYGASLPPGGGGGKYARIVSGSYDATIIVWRKDKEGVWKDQHHLKYEDAATGAMEHHRAQLRTSLHRNYLATGTDRPTSAGSSAAAAPPRSLSASALPAPSAGAVLPPANPVLDASAAADLHGIINVATQGSPQALSEAISAYPDILTQRSFVEAAIERQRNPVARSQMHALYSNAIARSHLDQARQRREIIRNQETAAAGPLSAAGPSSAEATAAGQQDPLFTTAQRAAAAAHQAHAQVPPNGGTRNQVPTPAPTASSAPAAAPVAAATPNPPQPQAQTQAPQPQPQPQPQQQQQQPHHHHQARNADGHGQADPHAPRVFKVEYDARRIICCTQRSVIVGWDFCNGDPELEEVSRFFAPVE